MAIRLDLRVERDADGVPEHAPGALLGRYAADVEDLVVWALHHQKAHAARGGERWTDDGRCHLVCPDALLVYSAIQRLRPLESEVVMRHGIAGTVPTWRHSPGALRDSARAEYLTWWNALGAIAQDLHGRNAMADHVAWLPQRSPAPWFKRLSLDKYDLFVEMDRRFRHVPGGPVVWEFRHRPDPYAPVPAEAAAAA